jgi:hypothetical protein
MSATSPVGSISGSTTSTTPAPAKASTGLGDGRLPQVDGRPTEESGPDESGLEHRIPGSDRPIHLG